MKKCTLALVLFSTVIFTQYSCKKKTNTPVADVKHCTGGDGILSNVAGMAQNPGGGGKGGDALDAGLYWPQDMNMDANGNLLIVDWNNHCVRKVATDGKISVLIGSGFLGDGATVGMAASAVHLNHPSDIAFDPNGNYWLAAWHNWKLKEFGSTDLKLVQKAGTSQGFGGDGGLCDTSKLNFPSSMVFDAAGNIYISDAGNQRIRKIDAITKIITTFVGSGAKGFADGTGNGAKFSMPVGTNAVPGGKLAISKDKLTLYCADTENHRIRKVNISTGEVTTIAGTGVAGFAGDGASAATAQLNFPTDIAVGPDNSLYIADAYNHCVRKIDVNGIITTVAGVPMSAGVSANCTAAKTAKLNTPSGVFVSNDNTLYIADTYNHQVKKVHNP